MCEGRKGRTSLSTPFIKPTTVAAVMERAASAIICSERIGFWKACVVDAETPNPLLVPSLWSRVTGYCT